MTYPDSRVDWVDTELGVMVEFKYGKGLPRHARSGGNVPVYGSSGIVGWHDAAITGEPCIVVGRKGSAGEVHYTAKPCWPIDTTYYIDEFSGCDPRFLFYLLKSLNLGSLDTSTAIPGLNRDHAYRRRVSIPPYVEQRAIADKVEALLSELDKGVEQLQTVKQQLKLYRKAVLKAAFEGKLTAEWREEKRAAGKLPEPEELCEKIDRDRELRGRSSTASGGSRPQRGKQISTQITYDFIEHSSLPRGWIWVPLAALGDLARGRSRHRPRNAPHLYGGPYPFIQTGDVKAANRVIVDYSQTYSEEGLAQSRLWPAGTLCITIAANIAESAFLGFDGCFPDSVVGFTASENLVNRIYVHFFLESVKDRIAAYAPATAQKNINLRTLENLIVPFCSREEQDMIVAEIESRFSVIDSLSATIHDCVEKANVLRQSILQKAFKGRLLNEAELAAIRTSSEYEPAGQLLKRLNQGS